MEYRYVSLFREGVQACLDSYTGQYGWKVHTIERHGSMVDILFERSL
jgi:hypothetical protein